MSFFLSYLPMCLYIQQAAMQLTPVTLRHSSMLTQSGELRKLAVF